MRVIIQFGPTMSMWKQGRLRLPVLKGLDRAGVRIAPAHHQRIACWLTSAHRPGILGWQLSPLHSGHQSGAAHAAHRVEIRQLQLLKNCCWETRSNPDFTRAHKSCRLTATGKGSQVLGVPHLTPVANIPMSVLGSKTSRQVEERTRIILAMDLPPEN